jgi:hypothetical protein
VTRPAPADYPSLCFRCHRLVTLNPADAVLAEARAIVGDLTIVFCGDCIREAARHFPL